MKNKLQSRSRRRVKRLGAQQQTSSTAFDLTARFNQALARHRGGQLVEAEKLYEQILKAQPNHFDSLHLLGVIYYQLGNHAEAVRQIDVALKINPKHAFAHANRGIALKQLKRFDEALASYDRAIALKPDYAEALTNRGNALKELKRFDEALASYDRALALKPDIVEALSNRGVTLQELKRLNEALASYDRALAVKPDYAEALSNRGVTLQELKRLNEALVSYDRALTVKPDYAEALNNRGDALKSLKRYEEAITNFERALSINPDFEYAKGNLLYSKMQCCDWRSYTYEMEGLKNDLQDGKRASAPFALICLSESASDQLLCSQIWVRDKCPASPTPIGRNKRFHRDRIRIAYMSADFYRHATSYLMAELFERHDRSRFEIIGVSFGLDDKSEMRKRLVAAFDQFYDVGEKSDKEIARLLYDLQVDIAIDLKGYTQNSRPGILAHRPARIQVNYLGYPGTMGADFIDYIIADETVLPFDQQLFYTEKIVHLPDSYQVNDTRRKISDRTPKRGEAGLPETGFVFCCFNNNYKITAPVFDVWMRLLRSVDGSVLWLLRDNAVAETNLRKEAVTRGVDPSRLIFAGRLPLEDHLARHRLADLFLDTMPVNAHTTASDALWAGLPVVTRLGEAFAGRVAASLLNAIGLPELVTHSIEDYEALALRLARDPKLLEEYRNRLAANRLTHPLFDTDRFRRHMEAGYLQMWEIWQRGEQPRSFAVEMERTQPPARQELPNLPQMLKQAAALHQKGEMAEAEGLYLQILKAAPNHFDARHLLGVLRHQQGRHTEALELIGAALKTNPNVPQALVNYGTVLDELKRYDEAVVAFDKALEIKPDDAETLYCRATTLNKLKRHEEALASYDKALAIRPQYAEALYNRGNALKDLDRYEEALASYDRALELRPDYVKALCNRGVTLQELKQYKEAIAAYDRAIALKPDYAEAFTNRGNVLKELHRFEEALASYDKALALKPENAEGFLNRGNVLKELSRFDEVLASYDKAIALKPDYAEALNNRGNALVELKRLEEALASYDKALALKPDYAEALNNRGNLLRELKRLDEALASYEKALTVKPDHANAFSGIIYCINRLCDWDRRTRFAADLNAHVSGKKSIISPFTLLGYSGDPALQLQCARNFVADKIPSLPGPFWTGTTWRHDKVRIGYLSADFRRSAMAHLIAELFERHDRPRFEIIGVSLGVDDKSEMRNRLVAAFDQFYDVRRKSDEEVAKLLHGLQIDIAIDLMGHTQHSRPGIFAYRPAPIQVNYLGYPGTMGAEFIDYIIVDKTVAPFEHQPFYTEKIVHLPDCYLVNDTKTNIAERTPTRQEAGLPETGFVFCCFNNNWKITPDVFNVWMRLLHAVEGSVFWLLRDNESAERNLRMEAQGRGIDPARLVFASRLPLEDHLARHRLADLFLDTTPVNAHTTASDALWAGLPVVTRLGEAFAGRVAASLLNAIGLPELVTHSIEDYEALALRLARDPKLLEEYRNRLAANRLTHPLFDTDRFRRHIEAGYLQMWEIWQRGEQPRSFAVETERTQPPARQELSNLPQILKRAVALHQKGEMAEAESLYLQILETTSDHFDARHLLGVLRYQQGRHTEALGLIGAALKTSPNALQALLNYGTVLDELKRYDEAVAAYDKALEIKPDDAGTLYCRATTLNKLKRHEEALASYDKALAIRPQYVEALYNRGNALNDLKRFDEALASYDKALAIKPDYIKALTNRAATLKELKRSSEALVCLDKVLAAKPDHLLAFGSLIGNAALICDWARTGKLVPELQARVSEYKSIVHPFVVLGCSADPKFQLQCARNYIENEISVLPRPLWKGTVWCHDKLRVAYLSADFRSHPVAYLMAELFEQHDRSRFDIIGISFGVDDRSEMRKRLVAGFDEFHDVRRKSDKEVAKLLYDLQIDAAIDLMGYTQDSRPGILAHRPAPIQVNYLGYPGTMGAEFIDYIIADKTAAPFEQQPFYTERIVHLPDCFQVNDRKRAIAARTPTREEAGLPAEGFVFCCFNNNWKITPTIFDVWMHLLSGVQGSVLWLSQANDAAVRNLRREADAREIDASRLIFAPRLMHVEDHLARQRLADLFLDTLPYNAHTTASDALWAGLPVLTCKGEAFAGRVAASLLHAIGIPELITSNLEEYQTLALKLARDPALLAELKAKLVHNRNTYPLFNTDLFVRHIEAAYTTMWETWQHGEAPKSFSVEPIQS